MYDACYEDKGSGVKQRFLDRLQEHLSKTGKKSPFAYVERQVSKALLGVDNKYIAGRLQDEAKHIIEQVYASVDYLVDDTVTDETEVAAREAMKGELGELQKEWENAHGELARIKMKYESQAGGAVS